MAFTSVEHIMRDVNNFRRDSVQRGGNNMHPGPLGKLRPRLTGQVGPNEVRVEDSGNRWKLLKSLRFELAMVWNGEMVASNRLKDRLVWWAKANDRMKTGSSSATSLGLIEGRSYRHGVYGYLYSITKVLSISCTGHTYMSHYCHLHVKRGNPGKLPMVVLYGLDSNTQDSWIIRGILTSTIGRVIDSPSREGRKAYRMQDGNGGKIAEKAKATGYSRDTPIGIGRGSKYRDRLSMLNSVLLRRNTEMTRLWTRGYSTTQESRKPEVSGKRKAPIRWPEAKRWQEIQEDVREKQVKLVETAERCGFHSKEVQRLQILMSRSLNFALLAVKKTITNPGSNSPGVDNETLTNQSSNEEKLEMVGKVQKWAKNSNYKSGPVKGVKIPKGNGKTRSLGIPTIGDRCLQNLINLVLEPLVESRSDPHSYGYRRYRSAKHALGYLRALMYTNWRGNMKNKWILDADIKGFFDNISHEWLLSNLPLPKVHKHIVEEWLKAKMFTKEGVIDIEMGTPQGGIISPTLANFTLNGLETTVNESIKAVTKSKLKHLRSNLKINLSVETVRFADDFIITARSKYILITYVLPAVVSFLKERGLQLSSDKTRIITLDKGLNFLGYTFKYKILWKVKEHFFKENIGREGIALNPQKEKVYSIIEKLREIFRKSYNESAYTLITKVNPILRGWYAYFNLSQSSKYRGYVRQAVYRFCMQWAMKKHPKWGKRRIIETYFFGKKYEKGKRRKRVGAKWVFRGITKVDSRYTEKTAKGKTNYLIGPTDVPIINGAAVAIPKKLREIHAYHPRIDELVQFNDKISGLANVKNLKSKVWKRQEGKCTHCGGEIQLDTLVTELRPELHHIKPISLGGSKGGASNLELIHNECHKMKHKTAG